MQTFIQRIWKRYPDLLNCTSYEMYLIRSLASVIPKLNSLEDRDDTITELLSKKDLPANRFQSFSWLDSVSPRFSVVGNQVTVIKEPEKFYDILIERCLSAKHRITLASLYLGTGKLEQNLVSAISSRLNDTNGALKVKVLLDFTRGSRGKHNSRSMLLPLIENYEKSCQVSLYHTPVLRGFWRRILPSRYNELVGLQHMKVYLFDDSVLISGANLSNDYFTNRQDRYLLIEDCHDLADFYDTLISKVCEFSLLLTKNNEVTLHPCWDIHPFHSNFQKFCVAAKDRVWTYFTSSINNQQKSASHPEADTYIYPLIEMGQLGLHHDSWVTAKMLETASEDANFCLSMGYFNPTQNYIKSIVKHSTAKYNILMAHPLANGFFKAKGLAGGIPAGYTVLATNFLKHAKAERQDRRIQMAEYKKEGWTYHAKGLWYTLAGETLPFMTLIGSSNFGIRSVHRDLETQIAVVTTNQKLQRSLGEEMERLRKDTIPFDLQTIKLPDRIPQYWVYFFIWFCNSFF